MMHRTALRGAFLAAAALTLAACSGDPAPGANPQSLMPSNNAYTSAFMQTNALGSAHLDLTVTTNLAGQQTIRTATGSISLGGPFGELTWHDTGIRERSNGQGVYLQDPAPDGPWRALPKGDTTDTMPLTQVLWGLGGADVGCADDPSAAGALHCTGTVPVDGDVVDRLGLPSAEAAGLDPSDAVGLARITIRIDERGRITEVRRSVEFSAAHGPLTVETRARLSNFAQRIDIPVPPTTATP